MKTCSTCKLIKDEKEFYKKGNSGRINSICKSCFNSYCVERWINKKIWAIDYLGGKCKVCSIQDHYSIYDFHHRDPKQKDIVWDKMRLVSKDRMVKELDKCDLLCSNCHRKLHSVH